MRVLVLGGYGNFGARIVRALAGDPAIELLIGGRDERRAGELADAVGHGASGIVIDHRDPALAKRLASSGVELLIHSAGPFQQQDYDVAEAAARAGAHCIDLADGRRFVCDFAARLDARFAAAGCAAISGASTVPALSSAVVDHLCHGWQAIDGIETCIAPAQTAPRGLATLEAVLSYCGAPIDVWDQGHWQRRRAWAEPETVHFARMAPRLGALADIPDLELFPPRYQVRDRVLFHAALELASNQRALAMLAALRSRGWIRRPERLAKGLLKASHAMDRLGRGTGGMVVRVRGLDGQGRPARRSWHITAPDDHGPEIACMAAILLTRRIAHGGRPVPGARACVGLLSLADFEPEFARWGMITDLVDDSGR